MKEYLQELLTSSRYDGEVKLIDGFTVLDLTLSEDRQAPTFMMANINPRVDVRYNLDRIERIVQIAHRQGVDILLLPELAVSGYVWDAEDRGTVTEHLLTSENRGTRIKPTLDRIKDGLVDQEAGLKMLVYGNVRYDCSVRQMYNTAFVTTCKNDYNDIFYDKIFLTPEEKKFFSRGTDQRLVVNTRWGRMGIMVCYDICFVGLAKRYAFEDEVDVIITLAAWRMEALREYDSIGLRIYNYYEYVWNLMHAAMAAHNQVWSIGTNCVGAFEKTGGLFCGDSGIWSPSGISLAQASNTTEELLIVRNVAITGHLRHQAREPFNYSLDFDAVYREIQDLAPREVFLD